MAEEKVVYAVRFMNVAGEAGLAELDRQMAEHCTQIDPDAKVTRGGLVSADKNPYPSAGFLHDGTPRMDNSVPMRKMLPEDIAILERAKSLAEQFNGTICMVFVRGQWMGSVHYIDEEGRHFYIEVTGGYK
jgi:hypothetical protein